MRGRLILFALLTASLSARDFDVASVKPSAKSVGKDYNNQITIGPSTFTARNVTLKRLIEEAYGIAPPQIFDGPKWLDESEFDVDAKAEGSIPKEELRKMLQPLLASRFQLAIHHESRELKVYELVVEKDGPKLQPVREGEGTPAPLGSSHFHGDLQQLANLISVQLTIPMLDPSSDPSRPATASGPPVPVFNRTGLAGTYDFDVEGRDFAGGPFNMWQHVLQEKLGLKLESRKMPVEGIVVDSASRVPVAN